MSFDHRPLYDLYHRVHKAINRFELGLCDGVELLNEFENISFEEPSLAKLISIEKELLSSLLEIPIQGEDRIRCLRRFEIILKRQRKIRVFVLGSRRGGPGNTLQTELFEVLNTFHEEIQKAATDQDLTSIERSISEVHGFLHQHTPGESNE
jgi:hypothetical protein